MKNKPIERPQIAPLIKVFGIGGGGCNSIARIPTSNLESIVRICANTDFHSLELCESDIKIKLGRECTHGLGTGGDPTLGKLAAEESYQEIIDAVKGADLLFLTAGLGGGTGSGGIEIIARIAKSMDIPTIAFVTLPFSFESDERKGAAYEATLNLQSFTNTIITIPNDRILNTCDSNISLKSALGLADDVLLKGILGITEIIKHGELLNIDFSYINKMLKKSGGVYISIGYGQGENRLDSAIEDALSHPLLEPVPIDQSEGVIVKVVGNIEVNELNTALSVLKNKCPADTEIFPVIDNKRLPDGQVKAAVLLTGMGATPLPILHDTRSVEQLIKDENHEEPKEKYVYSKSLQEYEDELEVPTFIRRGYNLANNKS